MTLEDIVRAFIAGVGEDPERPGLRDTPRRVVAAWRELLAGAYSQEPAMTAFDSDADEMVVVRGIETTSVCEHHLLPFTCLVSVGYLPKGRVLGLSKIPRLVEHYARRLQIQEQLTEQIADAMVQAVAPLGVGVVVSGRHLCATVRGVKANGTRMVTSAMRGAFRTEPAARAEFLDLVRRDHA